MHKTLLIAVCTLILFPSCRKKPDPQVVDSPSALEIAFENVVNGQPLVLESKYYTNENGDSFVVNKYKYYISNISLYSTDGTEFKEPESYHLVDAAVDSSLQFTISGVPGGNYDKIRFLIGVDSTRNVSGAQKGALDPVHGMFWDWESGYIMAMLEGTSPQSSNSFIAYHITGYAGEYNSLHWVTLSLPTTATVQPGKTPTVHMTSDVAEWFQDPLKIKFAEFPFATVPGPDAQLISNNYADMFRIDHVD